MHEELPFDPALLPVESEAQTRARNASVEWAPGCKDAVSFDDFALDAAFDPHVPSGGRQDRFTSVYDDLPVHVTAVEEGVLFGQEFLVCDRRVPTRSPERLYLGRLANITERLDTLTPLDVPGDTVYLVGASAPHRAFYHWCFQCLPGIALLREVARARGLDYRIVVPPLDATRERSLELLGIDAAECITLAPDRFLSGVPLLYTSATSGAYAFQPSARLITLLDGFRDAALEASNRDLPTRFFVSRRDAPYKRPLVNERELAAALSPLGIEEVVMSELALEDQIALFAGAELVVAPHGAGLVNLMFSPPTAHLVEIMAAHYRHACFFRLAQVRGVSYEQVLAGMSREDPKNRRHGSSIAVDVERVLAAVARFEQRRYGEPLRAVA